MRRSKRAHVQLKKKCATLHEELNEIETPGEGLHSFCRNLKCNCIFSPREEEFVPWLSTRMDTAVTDIVGLRAMELRSGSMSWTADPNTVLIPH